MPKISSAPSDQEINPTNTPAWIDTYDPNLGPNVLIIDDSLYVLSAVIKESHFRSQVKLEKMMKDYFQLTFLPRSSVNACSLRFYQKGKLVEIRRFVVNVSSQGRASKRWNVPYDEWQQIAEEGKARREKSKQGYWGLLVPSKQKA